MDQIELVLTSVITQESIDIFNAQHGTDLTLAVARQYAAYVWPMMVDMFRKVTDMNFQAASLVSSTTSFADWLSSAMPGIPLEGLLRLHAAQLSLALSGGNS